MFRNDWIVSILIDHRIPKQTNPIMIITCKCLRNTHQNLKKKEISCVYKNLSSLSLALYVVFCDLLVYTIFISHNSQRVEMNTIVFCSFISLSSSRYSCHVIPKRPLLKPVVLHHLQHKNSPKFFEDIKKPANVSKDYLMKPINLIKKYKRNTFSHLVCSITSPLESKSILFVFFFL